MDRLISGRANRRMLTVIGMVGCYLAGLLTAALSLSRTVWVNPADGRLRQEISIYGITLLDERPACNECFIFLPATPPQMGASTKDEWAMAGQRFVWGRSPHGDGLRIFRNMQEIGVSQFEIGAARASEFKTEYLSVLCAEGVDAAEDQVVMRKLRPAVLKALEERR